MDKFSIINYQGGKGNLDNFIYHNIEPYIPNGKVFLDIFCGAGAVSNTFRGTHQVYANDVEQYASIIADSILNKPDFSKVSNFSSKFTNLFEKNLKAIALPLTRYISLEEKYLTECNQEKLLTLYKKYPTVWNNGYSDIIHHKLTVKAIRAEGNYYLFSTYYAGNYFGIKQAVEIDALVKTIHKQNKEFQNPLFSCLFYAIKETVFSKDGHMAQPLNPEKNIDRLFSLREKSIYDLFIHKYNEYIMLPLSKFNGKNIVTNYDFEDLLKTKVINNVGLIYADPPYTDMQYSRYYHLLNVAAKYNYPELTKNASGNYTRGLYTEGRFQSKLSQRSGAKAQLEDLILFCKKQNINLALSYAYPQNTKTQATDRYTVSIDELIDMAKNAYGEEKVHVTNQTYNHANNRNSSPKKVLEYLIICGDKRNQQIDIEKLKTELSNIIPSKKNPMYDSHLYWSQKPYNVCDILIKSMTQKGDVVFDPFLGSGVTTLEAIKNGNDRKGIGCDINDMPIFISDVLLSLNNTKGVKEILDGFIKQIQSLNRYYYTKCPFCGKDAIISKTVFDKPDRKGNIYKIKSISYKCTCSSTIKTDISAIDVQKMTKKYSLKNIKNIELLQNSKIAVTDKDNLSNIFTGRNMHVLDKVLDIINTYDTSYQNILKYILMSILHLCKITDKHSNSQWPLWIPKVDCVEKNVIELLIKKVKKFSDVIEYMKENYDKAKIVENFTKLSNGSCYLLEKGCQNITKNDVPDDSVDLIITDPPYLEQVLYSEYMQLYKPFLGLNYNLSDEIVVSSSPSRKKSKDDYFTLLDQAFQMCSDKLKLNHYMCLYFHDSNLEVWNKLIYILEKNHFRFVSQIHIDKTNTLKNIISPKKSLNGDSVLFFIKDNAVISHRANEGIEEIEQNIVRQSKYMVKTNTALSTPELYDNGIMEILIQNGWLEKLSEKYSSLVDIFEKHLLWNSNLSKWVTQK
ncbi:DNA methyltransferase [Caproicibacterium sp. BJN0003]|uniref:DNA methyltransferase n=1 Tax=Caproicibacterium sp. BJN0003 TaxID=2994078 RepID=UPI002251865A|nr:DNA methyltransferase [Caproicibacterium sp. BJN0003]UZT82891.1 DNA methyltransferase [Caproicibacterium sp. BJN0003]